MFLWPEAETAFVSAVLTPDQISETYYFVFQGADILHNINSAGRWMPISGLTEIGDGDQLRSHYMGDLAGVSCFAVEADLSDMSKGDLRSLIGLTDSLMFSLAGRAKQILDWYRCHQYCGHCGVKTREHTVDRAMVCRDCNSHCYPRLSPSIITLVYDGDRVLLARNHRFPDGMYSTLAGFVEPGESIEQTVYREVKEEVGVTVRNLEYMGSQPWPFPNSLMLGFLAEYDFGDIVLQEEEIADARWFNCNRLPDIPGKVAISRWLIETYLGRLSAHP